MTSRIEVKAPEYIIPKDTLVKCPACCKITEKAIKIIISSGRKYFICSQICHDKIKTGKVYVLMGDGEVIQLGV